ncbi:MAG: XamI family restriction endonuclease [Planctomycetes bacterium]|nr:XamI family restriction endonuclease [Planctomycetota bacterium]
MPVNLNKPSRWKADIALSVDEYNQWFLRFAPQTFREEREKAVCGVEAMLERTNRLRQFTTAELRTHPSILFALRMSTAPPIARDRLVGLADVPKTMVNAMEKRGVLPPRMKSATIESHLERMVRMVMRLIDADIFPWIETKVSPTDEQVHRAATIVADRLCGANADPIVRNAQEQRQLAKIKAWLERRGYEDYSGRVTLDTMQPGQFAFRLNAPGLKEDMKPVNIPIDAVVKPLKAKPRQLPLLIEAKSAGDFTNTNKRRKEEATKVGQLRRKYGAKVQYVLFLCGYFNSGYLGYEAAEGIDWIWEHRMDDLVKLGL